MASLIWLRLSERNKPPFSSTSVTVEPLKLVPVIEPSIDRPVISGALRPKARFTMPPIAPPTAAPTGPQIAPIAVPTFTAVFPLLPMALYPLLMARPP